MKIKRTLQMMFPIVAGLFWLAPNAYTQFAYTSQDVMAVFRQTGSPDLEVNLGQVSFFYNLATTAPGSTVSINNYTPLQFSTAFSSAVGVNWAVMSAVPLGGGTTEHPSRTVWLTSPRVTLGTQTSPYQGDSGSTQGSWVSVIRGIAGAGGTAGAVPWGSGTPPSALTNSSTVAVIPSSDSSSYTQIGGTFGDLNGTFGQGSSENSSATPFSTQRSDFYEIHPNGGNATYLGYFDFDSNGALSFTAVPEPGSLSLFGLGGLFLLHTARCRKKSIAKDPTGSAPLTHGF
jgi:hypothetical protein